MRAAVALLATFVWAGCSTITSHPEYDQPTLSPLQFTVSTEPPPDGDGKITRDARMRITFDDYPDPDVAVFGPLLLRSGTATFDVIMSVDLVGKAVLVRPRSLLMPDTAYELVVDGKFRALSGRTVGKTAVATLTTSGQLNPSPSPSPVPASWEIDVRPILSRCAPYCHTPDRCPGRPGKRNPSRNLNLSGDPADPVLGLINVPSVALAGTPKPMLRVAPGDSARSVLLRKLLGGDPHADSADPPTSDLAIPGRRMPLYESVCGEDLPPPEDFFFDDSRMRLIQDWIDQGASLL